MQRLSAALWLGLLAVKAKAAIVGTNASHLRSSVSSPTQTSYGTNACPCVGIDNLKGYYATQLDFYHVQYAAETGSSCNSWDDGKHPDCRGSVPPQWCKQSWCYVDPCNCKLDVLPKQTKVGVTYQGSPAYWSYKTCGGMDFYTQEMSPDACVMQKTQGDCSSHSKCAWNGKQCGGKEVIESCKKAKVLDASVYGEEDCRCVGLGGRDTGKAFMHVNEGDAVAYSANVGSTCSAWEMDSHPDCLKDGEKPAWCSTKWCFVDPCKCSIAQPPKTVLGANKAMRFQGKTAYWSATTCGSKGMDDSHADNYCVGQETEAACAKMETGRCAWDGKKCLGYALVHICKKQQESGIMGMESPLGGGTHGYSLVTSLLVMALAIFAK